MHTSSSLRLTLSLLAGMLLLLVLSVSNIQAQDQEQESNCIVKCIHLLPQGPPIDVRVGGVLVAANLAFQRSQITQATVPCGPQSVQLFPTNNQTSFRTDNFAMASGENIYNYIVFGGEIRAPNATNVFLLSHEPVLMPPKVLGMANIAFWHYSPLVRTQQIQMDLFDAEGEDVLTALANFQQRGNYQAVPNANSLNFRFSNLSLVELLNTNRSLAGVRDGAGTAFLIGREDPLVLFLEIDPVGPEQVSSSSSSSSVAASSSSVAASSSSSSSFGGDLSSSSSSFTASSSSSSSSSSSNDLTSSASTSTSLLLTSLTYYLF